MEPRRAEGLSGPGKGLDGKPKFDLTKLDAAYFERLRSRVQAAGERGIYVSIMLDPEGKEAWQGRSGGKFDPFNSKYVVVGSRKTDMAPWGLGGGSTQVRLDYQGKDAMTAQLEEILEKYWYPAVPTCLVRNEGGVFRSAASGIRGGQAEAVMAPPGLPFAQLIPAHIIARCSAYRWLQEAAR